MSIYIFAGPTLCAEESPVKLEAVWLPPVTQGDLYRIAADKPHTIGIIDGYFEREPAVWHKEILWALAQGIHVFGSASMGALRAAELAPFGMIGVGSIYHQYLDGSLEDDDEVAIIHLPSPIWRYRPESEAMVNIRATLKAAAAVPVIGPELCDRLVAIAKALHYPLRSYPRILQLAADEGFDSEALRRLEQWLPDGRVELKKRDAIEMLEAIRKHQAAHPGPHIPRFELQSTIYSQRAMEEAQSGTEASGEAPAPAGVRDYLRRILKRQSD